MQSVSLYYRHGSSDKEYHVRIEPKESQYIVTFAYGRRGSTLQTGTKTSAPVDLPTATKIFATLVNEKKAKGYTEGEAGVPYQHTDQEERVSGFLPQLLNPIDESLIGELIVEDQWCAQEKFDGKRVLVQKDGAAIHGINRQGLLIGLPSMLVGAAKALPGAFVLDGECIGKQFHAFDLLAANGQDLREQLYCNRAAWLATLLTSEQQSHILLAPTAWKREEKAQLFKTLREQRKEGIVFKRIDAPYLAGRPNSGGTQLKCKFCATLSACVGAVNQRRSIELKLFSESGLVSAGNVAIPPNKPIPKVGQVVEVRYLYAFRESGCVYQPVYLGVRSDVLQTECLTGQLKFKNGEDES